MEGVRDGLCPRLCSLWIITSNLGIHGARLFCIRSELCDATRSVTDLRGFLLANNRPKLLHKRSE